MRRCAVDLIMFAAGVFCVVYLINPTAGFFEIIPDNAPFIGNIDEAAVTAALLAVLSYFGLDGSRAVDVMRRLAGRKAPPALPPATGPGPGRAEPR